MSAINFSSEYPRRLRAAVIGCGGHALRNVFPTFQYAPLDLVAVCDLNEAAAAYAARTFGGRTVYNDYQEMLRKEQPEVVFAVLNYDDNGHPRYPVVAADVMRAGADIWIEKPPASSSAEILQMKQVSVATDRFVGVGFKKMFAPANRKAKEILSRPEFGAISTITSRYPQSMPTADLRTDDKAMVSFLDHLVHPYSVIRFLGGPIKTLRFEREESTGASMTTIRFVNGAVGNLLLSAGQSGWAPFERTEICGYQTSLIVDNNIRLTYYKKSQGNGVYGRTGNYYGEMDDGAVSWEPEFSLGQLYNKGLFILGYAPEILDFCDCVLTRKPPKVGGLDDALELLKIYEAYRLAEGELHTINC